MVPSAGSPTAVPLWVPALRSDCLRAGEWWSMYKQRCDQHVPATRCDTLLSETRGMFTRVDTQTHHTSTTVEPAGTSQPGRTLTPLTCFSSSSWFFTVDYTVDFCTLMPPSGKKKIVTNDVMGFILASICKLSGSHGGRVWKAFLSGWRLMVRVPVVTAGLSTWNVHVLPVCQLLRYSKAGPLHSGHCRHHLWFTWYISSICLWCRFRPIFRSECFTICPWFYFTVSCFQVLSWKNPTGSQTMVCIPLMVPGTFNTERSIFYYHAVLSVTNSL